MFPPFSTDATEDIKRSTSTVCVTLKNKHGFDEGEKAGVRGREGEIVKDREKRRKS